MLCLLISVGSRIDLPDKVLFNLKKISNFFFFFLNLFIGCFEGWVYLSALLCASKQGNIFHYINRDSSCYKLSKHFATG
jgi:hypothetical protein